MILHLYFMRKNDEIHEVICDLIETSCKWTPCIASKAEYYFLFLINSQWAHLMRPDCIGIQQAFEVFLTVFTVLFEEKWAAVCPDILTAAGL